MRIARQSVFGIRNDGKLPVAPITYSLVGAQKSA